MKAAMLHKPNSPLTIETRDDLRPGKREILLEGKSLGRLPHGPPYRPG